MTFRELIGSRPFTVFGRNRIASWMSVDPQLIRYAPVTPAKGQ
jgi:hypothetical protein